MTPCIWLVVVVDYDDSQLDFLDLQLTNQAEVRPLLAQPERLAVYKTTLLTLMWHSVKALFPLLCQLRGHPWVECNPTRGQPQRRPGWTTCSGGNSGRRWCNSRRRHSHTRWADGHAEVHTVVMVDYSILDHSLWKQIRKKFLTKGFELEIPGWEDSIIYERTNLLKTHAYTYLPLHFNRRSW